MSEQLERNKRARIAIVRRFYLATGQDLEATLAFDRRVCDVLEMDPEVDPPTFLTDTGEPYSSGAETPRRPPFSE